MEPVGSSAGGSGSGSAGLGIRSGNKKKKARVESVYSRSPSYKKPKKPEITGGVVDSSAGPISVDLLQAAEDCRKKSWGSEVDSEETSVSEISDVENMKNTIAEETSYADSNNSEMDDAMDDATPRKTRTRTYVLGSQPKISFGNLSDNDDEILTLPAPKFSGSNRLPPTESRALEKRDFNSTKSFALNIEISAVPEKTSETKSEQETENSENKEEMASTYITKIPEFTGEDSETNPQEWLNKVSKTGDANGWNAARIRIHQLETNEYYSNAQILDQFIAGLKDKLIKKVHPHAPEDLATAIQQVKNYEMAMEEANYTKLVNLAIGETSSAAEKKIDQLTKKFEANKSSFLFSNAAANEQKAIIAMYTEAEVEGKTICLILDSGSTGIIVTTDGMKKTLVRKIDNFLFILDGITIPVKVLVMDAPQLENPITTNLLPRTTHPTLAFEFEPEEEKPIIKTFMALRSTSNLAEETEQEHFTPHSKPKTPGWNISYLKPESRKQCP
ncbi:hypothetical protein G9A89_002201 [Geosiphon pyriformis]|nr:hypothetical protein G9A89_002201 [Geosiphon pyriformis]